MPKPDASRRAVLLRLALRLALLGLAIWGLRRLAGWAMDEGTALAAGAELNAGLLALLLVTYALLLAVPFVPGVELGITLLMVGGAPAVPLVYLATVLGLCTAFAAGVLIPYPRLERLFADLGAGRAAQLVARVAPLDRDQRIAHLGDHLPRRIAPHALGHRHLLLAVLFNLPGNALIGGGGGIALIAGLSRLYAPAAFALTTALAVAPVPLIVWLTGMPPP